MNQVPELHFALGISAHGARQLGRAMPSELFQVINEEFVFFAMNHSQALIVHRLFLSNALVQHDLIKDDVSVKMARRLNGKVAVCATAEEQRGQNKKARLKRVTWLWTSWSSHTPPHSSPAFPSL